MLNTRVRTPDGSWRGLHSAGIRPHIRAIHERAQRVLVTDGELRAVLAGRAVVVAIMLLMILMHVSDDDGPHELVTRLLDLHLVKKNDLVILTKGELSGVVGGTNAMLILKVALE